MYQTRKTFIKPGMKLSDLIFENPSLLLMLEHFNFDIVVRDKTVGQACNENQISQHIFVLIANLYNGFNPAGVDGLKENDTQIIIQFLKNSHTYYLNEKIPEIHTFIRRLYEENNYPEVRMVESFFDEYSGDVKEHLDYEDETAFPYFNWLVNDKKKPKEEKPDFSVEEYRDHHTDIETKLADLKNLLLKHIPIKNDRSLRRRLLNNLFELELELNIHSAIEELILIPLIRKIEKQKVFG